VTTASIVSLASAYVQALLDMEREPGAANALIEAAIATGMDPAEIYLEVLPRALHEIGDRWEAGGISVGEEHLANSVIQGTMRALAVRLPRSARRSGTVVVAAVDRELHDNGPRIVADILDANGWDVLFVGAATPTDALLQLIREREPIAVALGATLPESLSALREAVAAIKTRLPHPPFVLIGGQAVPSDPLFWTKIGADARAITPQDAVQALEGIGGGSR
jgi:MerR family transcriptional regulator, light-induced transcriptional regulator